MVPPPALQEWKVVTETPQGIVTETVVVGGDEGGGSGNGEGGTGASGDSTSRDIDASVCLSARSAVHFQTHDYEACIKDIDVSTTVFKLVL